MPEEEKVTFEERRKALLMAAREHRENAQRSGKPMTHVIHVSRGLRDVALLFGYDMDKVMACAEVIITAAHADSAAVINDTWSRRPPKVMLNPFTGKPLPGEMTVEQQQEYLGTNPLTGKRWGPGEMQKMVDQGLKEKADLWEILLVYYFTRPNAPEAGRPWTWAMPYDTRGKDIVWEMPLDQGEAHMRGPLYRRFMAAFRNPNILKEMREHPIGALLAEGLSDEAAQAHVDAAALKYGLARTEPGDVIGMVPIYDEDSEDRKAVLEKSLKPEEIQKTVSEWYQRLRAEAN